MLSWSSKLPGSMKWVDVTVDIPERSGRNASFKDLAFFVEIHAKVANSTFGLKLFNTSSSKVKLPKGTKVVTLQTITKAESKTAKSSHSLTKCHCCSDLHKLYQCSKFCSMSVPDISQLVKRNNLSRCCLNLGHITITAFLT